MTECNGQNKSHMNTRYKISAFYLYYLISLYGTIEPPMPPLYVKYRTILSFREK